MKTYANQTADRGHAGIHADARASNRFAGWKATLPSQLCHSWCNWQSNLITAQKA
ncbi:hypothetical protein SPV1_01477 [Mariprofundus ferrooxydans PV-1]|uniref:Uncharacterized protein n=1 Tax=Mariprofundus ferrooxydans PV-1 TaxID=314345 RepID=Q0F2H3_9PROT|nr:hypothetical protein SPV1_01477 [Mariprofundus ferrooxydans PV-1]